MTTTIVELAPARLPDSPWLDRQKGAAMVKTLSIVAGAACAGMLVGWFFDESPMHRRFCYAYIWGFTCALALTLGALFWNLIHHISAAGWSVGIRRIFENLHRPLPILALLFIPIALEIGPIFKWSHASDLRQGKQIWLSPPIFILRFVCYFVVWIAYSQAMRSWSVRCDLAESADERRRLQRKMEWYAPSGLLLLALTSTFASFDLIMSLNYRWFSTIFGVIFWADCIRMGLCGCVLIVVLLRWAGYLRHIITREHLHDMGKLMLGMNVFWAYVAFAQYLLYWYGNIPEETKWYWDRRAGAWYALSIALPIGYFGVPFVLLLPRGTKRNPKIIGFVALWTLVFAAFHLYWEIVPEGLKVNVSGRPAPGAIFGWLDLASITAFAALIGLSAAGGLCRYAMIPIRDPRLAESIGHEVDEFGDRGRES